MKHLYLTITLLFAAMSGHLQAATVTTPADTLDHYVINYQPVSHFDGSQLVGKKIASYEITLINHQTKGLVRIHEILTEDAPPAPEGMGTVRIRTIQPGDAAQPAYVVDGKQVSKQEFEKLDAWSIESITVIKKGSQEDFKKYVGWENGVILVKTKKNGWAKPADAKPETVKEMMESDPVVSVRGEKRDK